MEVSLYFVLPSTYLIRSPDSTQGQRDRGGGQGGICPARKVPFFPRAKKCGLMLSDRKKCQSAWAVAMCIDPLFSDMQYPPS